MARILYQGWAFTKIFKFKWEWSEQSLPSWCAVCDFLPLEYVLVWHVHHAPGLLTSLIWISPQSSQWRSCGWCCLWLPWSWSCTPPACSSCTLSAPTSFPKNKLLEPIRRGPIRASHFQSKSEIIRKGPSWPYLHHSSCTWSAYTVDWISSSSN